MSGLAYHPSEHIAATTGVDGVLSIWRRGAANKRPDKAPAAWRCTSTAAYKGALDCPVSPLHHLCLVATKQLRGVASTVLAQCP